jgi:hypothetical protein
MGYIFAAGIALLAGIMAYRAYAGLRAPVRTKVLRWGLGGGAALLTAILALFRRLDLAVFTGAAAFSILRYGRLGPWNLDAGELSSSNISKVKSRYFAMELDHDSGTVAGRVAAGKFAGADLIDLGEMESRALLDEVAHDPDSLSLLESWLDANRAGWREYFAETAAPSGPSAAPADPEAEALAVLGLERGASAEDIQAAHHKLMKGVHPDLGGSDFLAAKINEARDLLLKSASRGK